MLTGLRVQNFKAFQDTGQLDLKPFTLLAGINSAGKSSILQALLLLKQTLESGPTQALTPGKGPWLGQSLGDNFNDFVFGRPALEKANLVYSLDFEYTQDRNADLYAEYKALLNDDQPISFQETVRVTLRITFDWGTFGSRSHATVRVKQLRVIMRLGKQSVVGLQIAAEGNGFKVTPLKSALHHTLQNLPYEQLEVDGLSSFLPDSLIINAQSSAVSPVPPALARLFREIFVLIRRDLGEQVYYLNSFRLPPAPIYQSGQTSGLHLDPNGGNFAAVLWRFRNEPVWFVFPDGSQRALPLQEMITRVLSEVLHLSQTVQVQPIGNREDILEVRVETLGKKRFSINLAGVGLGYNQVLPVIVQGLLTPPGGLVIFEQPEIHLHPDVQAKLILFFTGLARSGRRVLVETHSSHMIEHLCLEIAEDRSNWLVENAQTLFVHAPDADHAGAWIEPVIITPYGEILNWPSHFLPDIAALDEAILKAGFAKQRKAGQE